MMRNFWAWVWIWISVSLGTREILCLVEEEGLELGAPSPLRLGTLLIKTSPLHHQIFILCLYKAAGGRTPSYSSVLIPDV